MDTFPATVTKFTKVSEVAMVNRAYQCPYAYYGYPCYRYLPTSPNSWVCCGYKAGNLGRKCNHEGHQ